MTNIYWNGEDCPPAGTDCLVTPHNTQWGFDSLDTRRVKALAYSADHVWLMELHSDGSNSFAFISTRTDKVDFAPYLTPEQIRDEAARELCIDAGSAAMTPVQMEIAYRLYDAGYRKQVAP